MAAIFGNQPITNLPKTGPLGNLDDHIYCTFGLDYDKAVTHEFIIRAANVLIVRHHCHFFVGSFKTSGYAGDAT
jgi:hypothetical protein